MRKNSKKRNEKQKEVRSNSNKIAKSILSVLEVKTQDLRKYLRIAFKV